MTKCIHDKNKYRCIICSPSYFCTHEKYKYNCTKCNPELNEKRRLKKQKRTLCEHNKRKDSCVKCSGCEHNKLICILCNPKQFCIHKKKKTTCKECLGGSICKHGTKRTTCKDCEDGGGSLCIHKIRKNTCKKCKGNSICIHNKMKECCIDCDGSRVCCHKKLIYNCKICKPEFYIVKLQSNRVRNVLKSLNIKKNKNTIKYLGCSSKEFYEYIKSKMTDEMTIDNIHIDHIKPISRFNLENTNELYECCHWSNLQPLLKKDNLEKSNKWTEEDEINWRKNIIKFIRE